MRRADRLFQIVQFLRRRRRRIATAAELAERFEVSERTVYRDVRDLMDSGVPIRGEAGVGYLLDRAYDLPPLMFDEDELEALVLGVRMVRSWTDPALALAAESVLSKVEAVVPPSLAPRLEASRLFALNFRPDESLRTTLGHLRAASSRKRRITMAYLDAHGQATDRVVRPLALFYWGNVWTLAAWCELRQDFRTFRVDRIGDPTEGEPFEEEPGRSFEDLLRKYREEERETG